MATPLSVACEAALAGGVVLANRTADIGQVRSKGSATDFVTETDIDAGVAIVKAVLEREPHARVVVEEPEVCERLGIAPGSLEDESVWVIDPLDGTTSYLHGFPCYSVSVALVHDGTPMAGAVYNAALGQLVSAEKGGGATLDGSPVSCSRAARIEDSLLVTGFPYDRGAMLDRQLATLGAFLRASAHGLRRDGSAAVDCCHVAVGRADGFWEFALKPWDMAAGAVICAEAGATVTDTEGERWSTASSSIITANPLLHPLMLEVIRSV